jgi:hypothetical protein
LVRVTTVRLLGDALKWREIGNEVVAVDVRSSTYLSANESGQLLWRHLAEGTTRQQLVERLVTTFAIDEARAGKDVDSFLRDLAEQGLLVE